MTRAAWRSAAARCSDAMSSKSRKMERTDTPERSATI
jgi:hypothetical protein